MDISKIDPKIFKRRRKILPLVSTNATAGLWWWLNSPRDLELQLYCISKCFCIYICSCIRRCMCIWLCVSVIAWVIWLVVTQGLPGSQREPVPCSCQSKSSQADSADRFTHLACFKDGGGGPRVPRAPRQGGGGEERLVEGSEPRACSSSRGVSAAARPPAVQIDITHQQRVDHVSLNHLQTCRFSLFK